MYSLCHVNVKYDKVGPQNALTHGCAAAHYRQPGPIQLKHARESTLSALIALILFYWPAGHVKEGIPKLA